MISSKFKKLILALILPFVFFSLPAIAEERILSFDSFIDIKKNGDMIVTETIKVLAEGVQIRRGIYRDFPTIYVNNWGVIRAVGFKLLSVKRNNQDETWRTTSKNNGIRIYIGDAKVSLPQGEHTFIIRYKTTRQLLFFDGYDELYWNVTGNGWSFPIDKVSAQVKLPLANMRNDSETDKPIFNDVNSGDVFMQNAFGTNSVTSNNEKIKITMEGFTGKVGSIEQSYRTAILKDGAMINSSRKLNV